MCWCLMFECSKTVVLGFGMISAAPKIAHQHREKREIRKKLVCI